MNLYKKKYNSSSFINEFQEINQIRKDLVEYTRKYLTTEHSAKYIINTSEKFYS